MLVIICSFVWVCDFWECKQCQFNRLLLLQCRRSFWWWIFHLYFGVLASRLWKVGVVRWTWLKTELDWLCVGSDKVDRFEGSSRGNNE